MQKEKKYLGWMIAALGLVMGGASSSFAAFAGLARSTSTASAVLSGAGTVAMSVSIHKTADNSADTAINWTGVTLPRGFVVANDYIQLNSTMSATGGGIQIYTDNTAADASPKFTGSISSFTITPAGLVDTTTSSKALPMAWTIQDTSGTPVAINPNAGTGNSFSWLFFEDHAQVAVPSLGAGAFVNGDPFVTVQNVASGIHFAQGPTQFGPAVSPNYIYTEADFTTAVTPNTYKTSTLRLEAYTQ